MNTLKNTYLSHASQQPIEQLFTIRDHLKEVTEQLKLITFLNQNLTETMFNNMIRETTFLCLLSQAEEFDKIPNELDELISKLKQRQSSITVISGSDGCILSDLLQIIINELESVAESINEQKIGMAI